jgi:hypothetical protein
MGKNGTAKQASLKRLKELAAKPWHKMTRREQEEEVALYERVGRIPLSESRPLTQAERTRLERELAPRRRRDGKSGRALTPSNAKQVVIKVEPRLLKRIDAYADAHGMSRSRVFARGAAVFIDMK